MGLHKNCLQIGSTRIYHHCGSRFVSKLNWLQVLEKFLGAYIRIDGKWKHWLWSELLNLQKISGSMTESFCVKIELPIEPSFASFTTMSQSYPLSIHMMHSTINMHLSWACRATTALDSYVSLNQFFVFFAWSLVCYIFALFSFGRNHIGERPTKFSFLGWLQKKTNIKMYP